MTVFLNCFRQHTNVNEELQRGTATRPRPSNANANAKQTRRGEANAARRGEANAARRGGANATRRSARGAKCALFLFAQGYSSLGGWFYGGRHYARRHPSSPPQPGRHQHPQAASPREPFTPGRREQETKTETEACSGQANSTRRRNKRNDCQAHAQGGASVRLRLGPATEVLAGEPRAHPNRAGEAVQPPPSPAPRPAPPAAVE